MPNKKVALIRLCKTRSGWRRYPVAFDDAGQIKPDRVIEHGRERVYPTGHYEVRFYQGRKTQYANAGNDPAKALEMMQAKITELQSAHESVNRLLADWRRIEDERNVYLPDSLLQRAEEIAHDEGVERDVWIAAVIGERVGAIDAGKKQGQ